MFAHLKIVELKPAGISMLYSAKTMTSIKMKHITCTVQDHNHITGKLHRKILYRTCQLETLLQSENDLDQKNIVGRQKQK